MSLSKPSTTNKNDNNTNRKLTAKEKTQIFGITIGRTLRIASLSMIMPSGQEMLFKIFKGDYNAMSRFGSTMMSINTILSFFIQPYSGAFMDYYGRWPMLVLPPIFAGIMRIWLALNPSKTTYTTYRIVAGLVAIPWFPAYRATFSDLFNRGSDQYVQTMNNIENVSSILRLGSLYVVGNYLSAEQGYLASGIVSLLSGMAFYFFVEETLKDENRTAIQWKKLRNPLSSLTFFSRSKDLINMAYLYVFKAIPDYNMTLGTYRRQKFGWGMKEQSNQQMMMIIFSLSSPWMILRILNHFGAKGAFIFSHRLSALQKLYNMLNNNPSMMWVTVLISAFQFPETSFQRELANCVKDCGGKKKIGEGVQEAAMANINLPLAVILPRLYSELHIYFYDNYDILYAPLVFTMFMHLCLSEIVVHRLWPNRDENGKSKENILYDEDGNDVILLKKDS